MSDQDTEELVTSADAARMLGMSDPSAIRYHARKKRLLPAKVVKCGKISTPYYRPSDVRKLGEELAWKYPERADERKIGEDRLRRVPENSESLMSAGDAANLVGVRDSSTIAYHVAAGNIKPAATVTMGGKDRLMFRREDVEKLRDYLDAKQGRRGKPRKN